MMENQKIIQIINLIKSVVGQGQVQLHQPVFKGNEYTYLKDCIDSTFVSSVGKYVDLFEAMLAQYTGSSYVIATVNGTTALQIALELVGIERGDEVLVPALTFAATANAVIHCGGTPHFVDSCTSNFGINVEKLKNYLSLITKPGINGCVNINTGKKIAAIVPVHIFGHPCDIDRLVNLSREFKIPIVEDAAESLGSLYNNQHTGTFGKIGVLSFNGNKIVTTGGGGAILTNDKAIADAARHLTTTAKIKHPWRYIHEKPGYNFRMPNINAAIGCAQMENIDSFIASKRMLYTKYKEVLQNIEGITLFTEPQNCRSNYWLQTLLLGDELQYQREDILQASLDNGISMRPSWELLNKLQYCQNFPKMDLTGSELISRSVINIPSGPGVIQA